MVVERPTVIDRISPTRRPDARIAGYQKWANLLFLHWRISPAEARSSVPDWLSVDLFDGSAWIGLVLFSMSGVRPWWSPPIPGVSSFPETNVRTYVHLDGVDPGVWFLSLDAGGSLGARIGRSRWGLPYHHSKMRVRRSGTRVSYECERLWPGKFGVGGRIEAEIGDVFEGLKREVHAQAVPGSLEHFLIERYILYAQKVDRLLSGDVHHHPYPLHEAKITFAEQSFLADLGLHCDRPPDHVIFSEGVSVEVFPLRSVVGES
jgi:uncharacterized protein YqjF (DUF2071 family)